MAAPPPWKTAWERVEIKRKDTVKPEEWRVFERLNENESNPGKFIQHLEDVKSQVDEKYSPRFSRIVELLGLMRTTGGQIVQYGPQTVGIAFTAFNFIFQFVKADKDLCDTVSITIENVVHWIFVGEIYTRKYNHDIEEPSTNSNEREAANATLNGTIDLFVVVLTICLEISHLKLTHDREATGDDCKDGKKSISGHLTSHYIKKPARRATDSFLRRVKAFFGKESVIQSMLEDGKCKLAKLHENSRLSFQVIAEKQLKNLEKGIHDLPQRLHAALDPLQEDVKRVDRTTMETQATVKRIERILDQDGFNENLLWLQPGTALPITQPRDRQGELKPTAGTCKWIFEHESYQSWKTGKTHVCWLFGEPGVGKSCVTSSVIDKLAKEYNKPLVLSFFCQTGSDAKSKSKHILLHLLAQLFQSCAELELYEARRECLEIIKRAKGAQSRGEYRDKMQREEKKSNMMSNMMPMEEIQKAFHGLLKVFQKNVFIIVDALDECTDSKVGGLLDALVETGTQEGQQNVFLWISSRHEDPMREVVEKGETKGQFNVVHMEKEKNHKNIRTYLEAAFLEMDHLPNNLRDQAERAIIKQARGSFLRASIAINALNGEKANFDIRQALDDLPMEMTQSWQQKWESLSLYQRKQLSIALRWLVCARGPVTTTLIADEIEKKYSHQFQKSDEPGDSENDNLKQQILKSDGGDDENCGATLVLPQAERPSIKALKEFARDFLEFHGHDTVQLRSRDVRDWVFDHKEKMNCEGPQHCPKCLESMQSSSTKEFAPKHGALQMALYIMRTINNKEFQKEHLFHSVKEKEDFQMFMNDKMYPDGSTPLLDQEASTSNDQADSSNTTQEQSGDQFAEAEKADTVLKGTSPYNDLVAGTEALGSASDASSETSTLIDMTEDLDEDAETRYEFRYWEVHMRAAEDHWLPEERISEEWTELYSLAERFMDGRSPAFRTWVDEYINKHERLESYNFRLHVSVGCGIIGLMDRFIDQGDSMSQLTTGYGTPLHAACEPFEERLTMDQFERVLDKSVDAINIQENQSGSTPVYELVASDAPLQMIKLIVEKYGARIDIPTKENYFPIHWAAIHPDVEVCRYFVGRQECNPNVVDNDGETPLHWLLHLYDASPEIVEILIENGASVCAKDNENQQPLYEAARTNNVQIGELLLRHHACADAIENTRNWTALHQAVSKGHVDFVKMLLRYGPIISLEDTRSKTALHLAAEYGHHEILEAILKYLAGSLQEDAEIGPADSDRETQAHPHDENLQTEMVRSENTKALLRKSDRRNNTPLHKAASYGHVDCTKLIIKYGNAKQLCAVENGVGATPLHLALRTLLELKAGFRNYTGKVKAIQSKPRNEEHIKSCIRLLLQNGADPIAQDKSGTTPLSLAVYAKDGWSVQLLIQAGADPMQAICSSDKTTIVQKIVEPWREQELATNDNEELVKALLRSSNKLPQEVCLNILNIALERRAVGVMESFTARLDDEDQHGWSLLALAVQFREGSLIDRILLSRPEGYFPRWSSTDKHEDVLVSEDGIEASCSPSRAEPQDQGKRAVRADFPIPPGMDRYYYEIEIVECGSIGTIESVVGIGFASQFLRLDTMPGWTSPYQSWGYHGNDGHKYGNKSIIEDGHAFGQGDTVGAGVDFAKREIFFTKNGTRLGNSFSGEEVRGKLFPMAGFHVHGVKIRTNFGTRDFMYPVEWCKVHPADEAAALAQDAT